MAHGSTDTIQELEADNKRLEAEVKTLKAEIEDLKATLKFVRRAAEEAQVKPPAPALTNYGRPRGRGKD